MMIHEITEKAGSHKQRKRIGRGPGSGHGKTSGRGHNGAGSRSGASIRASREGGQMPFFRRVAKRGFSNVQFTKRYALVNIRALDARFDDGAEVNPDMLVKVGLIPDTQKPVKILGDGETNKKLMVTASAASKSASEKISKAGGTLTLA